MPYVCTNSIFGLDKFEVWMQASLHSSIALSYLTTVAVKQVEF